MLNDRLQLAEALYGQAYAIGIGLRNSVTVVRAHIETHEERIGLWDAL